MGQEPALITKASQKGSEVDEDVKASLNSLMSIMEEEKDKRRRTRLRNLDRHTQFSGTFTRLAMDGSKTLFKGNPGTASHDSLLKSHKVQRGPQKRIAWDSGTLSSSKENILEVLRDFINQFLSAGYNVLMQSIREDIEKEHHAIQNSDVVVFFQVAQFVTAFQHHTFLISKPKTVIDTSETVINKFADSTFQGDICGPIAATLNEAMFLLVIYKWRSAFEGLKETNDYKFLSVAGSLMKNMIRMLDLVLKLFPEDSKEPQTARILLYKIFYDQTDQGMTQFLVNLIKSFDTHKQPKSDLADLIEMIHVVVRLMENLQARGTLRVSRKSRRGKKKKIQGDKKVTVDEQLGGDQVNIDGDVGKSTCKPSVDSNGLLEEPLANPSSDGKEESTLVPDQVEELEVPLTDSGNTVDDSALKENKQFDHNPDDLECEMGDSSEDDPSAATDEVDFKISSLVATFANNSIIENLCWLLRFYKSNSTSTNHYILSMLRRICDDLELSPMLYQLSLLTTFYDILDEQKSSTRKEYANIVSFLTNLLRKMLRKMKSQPLLFVEVLFWKTRKECHYINSESLLNELGNLRKETKKWGTVSPGNEGEVGPSQGQGGIGRRSIADALGDDEFDVVISQEGSYQKDRFGDRNKSMTSGSNSEIDGVDNLNLDDAHNEGHSVDKSLRVPKRKKRLVFDPEMETNIKNLYEKHKDERHCTRLIAEALDPDGKVSPVQVSNKLKQLGLKVASKKRMLRVDSFPKGDDGQIRASESDSALHSLADLEESSLLKRSFRSRKRIRAFSKEQELMVKDLYEQFKHHKRCSHMIATALDADNTFTAAQISRKIKQLGLIKEKRPSAAKLHLRDEDADDIIVDEGAEESDEETLLALKRRSKKNQKSTTFSEGVTATGFAERNIETMAPEDDSDDKILSSILEKTGRKLPSKARDEKTTTNSIDITIDGSPEDEIERRNEHGHANESGLSHKDLEHDLSDVNGNREVDQGGNQAGEHLNNVDDHVPHQLMDDELEDSGDDVEPIASKGVVLRRKLKMVIDMDDE